MRETEIRPDHLLAGQARRVENDIQWLLARKGSFMDVACPACGSEGGEREFGKRGFDYCRCKDCETVYLNPRPTPAILEEFYQTSENYRYWNEFIFPASENARRVKIFRPRAQRVLDICQGYGVQRNVLLDVGAGYGTFCEEVKRCGNFRRVIAVEPTPDLAETCRRKGLEVVNKPIEQAEFDPESVDVVACFEVLEHLFAPQDFLRACASVLRRGGLLFVSCPNIKGFDLVVLRELSNTIDHEHLNYFNPESLSRLVGNCGLKTLEVLTPGSLDAELVRKEALRGNWDISHQPFLRQVLMDEWDRVGEAFQKFLADHLLSSHMWLVARKDG